MGAALFDHLTHIQLSAALFPPQEVLFKLVLIYSIWSECQDNNQDNKFLKFNLISNHRNCFTMLAEAVFALEKTTSLC